MARRLIDNVCLTGPAAVKGAPVEVAVTMAAVTKGAPEDSRAPSTQSVSSACESSCESSCESESLVPVNTMLRKLLYSVFWIRDVVCPQHLRYGMV